MQISNRIDNLNSLKKKNDNKKDNKAGTGLLAYMGGTAVRNSIILGYGCTINNKAASLLPKIVPDKSANIGDALEQAMIKSNLKEGSNAQRVIVETYNYDLRNNKEISLEEVLAIEYLDKNDVQNRIDTKIAQEQRQVEDLKELGYNIYNRDTSSEQYKVENSNYFYLRYKMLLISLDFFDLRLFSRYRLLKFRRLCHAAHSFPGPPVRGGL